MPVSLSEWRVRIGRYIQHPPDINKREMIERFLERWKEKKEKSKAAANQTGCHRTGSGQSSSVTQVLAEPLNLRRSCFYWYRPLGTSLVFGRCGKPSWSSVRQKTKVRKRKPSAQTPWLCSGLLSTITQVLTEPLDLVMSGLYWCQSLCNSLIFRRCCKSSKSSVRRKTKARKRKPSTRTLHISSVHISSITRVLAEPLNLRRSCLYWYRTEPMSLIFRDYCKPPKSSVPSKTRVTAHKPNHPETPSCSAKTNLMPPAISPGLNHLSSATRVLAESLNWRRSYLYWYRPVGPTSVIQYGRPAEGSLPPKTKNFTPGPSCFSNGVSFRKSMSSYTMGGLCHLYLPMILLMRAGDIETNPGPESTVSGKEFMELSKKIQPCYYSEVGVTLGIDAAELDQIIVQHSQNYRDAFMTVFTRWRNKQSPGADIRALLTDRFKESGLHYLTGILLAGSQLDRGKPSKPPGTQTIPAQSQIEPLSPELIERCTKDFKFKYRSTLCKIRSDPLNPASLVQFEKLYTNLVLEAEDGTDKQSLDYNKLLDLKVNGEFPKRLMVQGEAGAGKTTFCAKIAWDWLEGRYFTDYVWVLIVPLRQFKHHTIGQIAKSYLTRDNPATASQLTYYIRSNPDKVFIALDGLDEFSGKVIQEDDSSKPECHQSKSSDQMQLQSSQSSSATNVHKSDTWESPSQSNEIELVDIIRSYQLEACPVLVTTRPWKATEVRSDNDLMKLYSFIHIEGFNRENLSDYIHKYFPNDEAKANRLIQFTHENDVISDHLAHYPIYVAMLCCMWKVCKEQELEEMKSLQTFSQIFKKMFAFLKEHYAQKKIKKAVGKALNAYLKEINELLKPIAELALSGVLGNSLTFSEDDFKKFPESMDTACRVGLLSHEDRIIPSGDEHDEGISYMASTVFFPHKLFQEYMAGVCLATLYESDNDEFNRIMKQIVLPRKKEFRFLLYFTVSKHKVIANHVMKCMVQDKIEMKDVDFLVDVAFESQDQDVAAILRDRVSSEKMKVEVFLPSAHTVAGYLFTGIYKHVVALMVTMSECGRTMSHDMAEIICCGPSLHDVSLSVESFHIDFFAVLAKEGNKAEVQSVFLSDVKCPTAASSQNLAEALCSMPNLTRLELHGVDLSEEFYATLKGKALTLHVQSVSLSEVKCPTAASSQNLAEALCSMPNVTRLELHGVDLSEEFCATLKGKALTLHVHTLCLDELECLTAGSSQNLAEALCSMPELTNLKLETMFHEDLHDFAFTLKAKASSTQGCFPQISKGKFFFNEAAQENLDSFLCSLADISRRRPLWYHRRSVSQPSAHPQQQPMGDVDSPHPVHPPSSVSQPVDLSQLPMGDVESPHPVHPPSRVSQPVDMSRQQPMGDVDSPHPVHSPSSVSQPVDLSQQPMGDVDSPHPVHPSSSVSQPVDLSQQPMGDVDSPHPVHPPSSVSHPSDHPQQQPMGDEDTSYQVHAHHPKQQTIENIQLSVPSENSPSTISQDTEDQFFHSSSGGCSSSSRSRKRQAPCTQSPFPKDTSVIPEKQVRVDALKECSFGCSLVDYPSSDDSD